jgi:VCBS repeat-containing protein
MGKNLGVMFDGSKNSDVVIEDFYADNTDADKDNGMPTLVGLAENGGMYEYVPQDPAASSMPGTLKDGNTPVIVSLGGGPLTGDFVLAGLPLVAAAGGGLGGWLAGGALVAAAAAGGSKGGGTPSTTPVTVAAPTIAITTDGNTDGFINKDEVNRQTDKTKFSVKTTLPSTAVVGDTITVTDGTTISKHVLTTVDITKTYVTDSFGLPDEGSTINVTAKTTTVAGLSSASASATAKLDTVVANNVDVNLALSVSTDVNNDGFVNSIELGSSTTFTSHATFDKSKVMVGDSIVFTAKNGTGADVVVRYVLTAADLLTNEGGKGIVDVTFTKPKEAEIQTVTANFVDIAGNPAIDAKPTDSATLDTTAPDNDIVNLGVRIITDVGPAAGGDGVVSSAELNAQRDINNTADTNNFISRASFNSHVVAGDKIIFTATNGTTDLATQTVTLTAADINRGFVEVKFARPADGQTQTVTAMYADAAGNADTTLPPTDFAKLDNSAPNGGAAPVVSITTDGANGGVDDGFVNNPELRASTVYHVEASFDSAKVAVGDTVVLKVGSNEFPFVLDTQAKVDAGKVSQDFTAPSTNGASFTVTAVIKDAVGNTTATGTDSTTRNFLVAADDSASVTAPTTSTIVTKSDNVIANDVDPQFLPNPASPAAPKVFVSGIKLQGAANFDALSTNGGTVAGTFGSLTIHADGSYTYTLNKDDAAVAALGANDKQVEKFVYQVTDAAGNESTATLSVNVTGVNDNASHKLKDENKLSINDSNSNPLTGGANSLVITDNDAGESVLPGVAATVATTFIGHYGNLALTQSSSTATTTGYSYVYTKNPGLVSSSDTVRHDLFTFQTKDGTDSVTFDIQLGATGTVSSNEYHAKSTAGLKIATASSTTTDTLALDGTQLAFDFTGTTTTTNIHSIEVIDITGGTGSNNTIKLDLNSLTQADLSGGVHKLFIKGDSGDTVLFNLNNTPTTIAHDAAAVTVNGSDYWVYKIGNDELLVQTTINNITVNG